MKLIRLKVCHNIHKTDELNGGWHKGYRKSDSESAAFYFKKKWYLSNPAKEFVDGPFLSKNEALQLCTSPVKN